MKYVLKGNIVTFNSKRKVLKGGYVAVQDERIAYVGSREEGLPAKFHDFTQIATEGYSISWSD